MKKIQVDLENAVVHIADSKTANGIGDMPMTAEAREAFRRQIEETPGSEYLFPSPKSTGSKPYITNVRKGWAATLKKAGVPYFALYELRHRADFPVMPTFRGGCRFGVVWRRVAAANRYLKSA